MSGTSLEPKSIAVLGAGPVGIEAALYAARLGHDVRIYERGRVGAHVADWGHVRLFTPWSINASALGREELRRSGLPLPDANSFPTGLQLAEEYLRPVARAELLAGRVHERCTVLHVGREGIGKRDLIGGPRSSHPFRLLIADPSGEKVVHGDVVLDCTGTYGNPNWIGSGNIPAIGERELRERIHYRLPDIEGAQRSRFEGRRCLVVGSGFSAATSIDALLRLPGTHVDWVVRDERNAPYAIVADDPLPERARLSKRANALAEGADPRVTCHRGCVVDRLSATGDDELEAHLRSPAGSHSLRVHAILGHAGQSPDRSICRELQFHECYATFGPMKLAATLLASDSTDCLAQHSTGPETLRNPEPGFFVLGAKSYGKNSSFLIRLGLEQIRDAFALIENQGDLDLYATATR